MELHFHQREFEYEVRNKLQVFDRSITSEDARTITELDLTNFDFLVEDKEVLCCFNSLTSLGINIGTTTPDFWWHFPKLRNLYLCCWGDVVDFESFRKMTDLGTLCVSGGDLSDIDYINLTALQELSQLAMLELHEFGSVDIAPLASMTQLKCFALRYADKVQNIEAIGSMVFLEELVMDGLWIDNLNFLDTLPESVKLEMCGIHLFHNVDVRKWKRFSNRDICEIEVKNEYWEYIDLSDLSTTHM